MGGLTECISIHNLSEPTAKKIRAAVSKYEADGMSPMRSVEKAILGEIASLEGKKETAAPEHEAIVAMRKDVKKIVSKLPEDKRTDLGEIEQVEVDTAQTKALRKVAKKFGKDVVFFKGEFARGAVVPRTKDTILINENQKADALFVLGHELLHTLRLDNPKLYKQFGQQIAGGVKDYNKYAAEYRKEVPDAKDAEIIEELLADFTGEQFTDPKFLSKLSKDNPALFDKIAEILTKLFNQLGDITGVYFAKVRDARNALASVMKDYAIAKGEAAPEKGAVRTLESGIDVKYDGDWEMPTGPGRPQYTVYSGKAKGATFTTESHSDADIQSGVDRMVSLRKKVKKKKADTKFSRNVNTAAFKKWFGDSKVVDENGEPLVVYHGTANGGFMEFDINAEPQTMASDAGIGFFFSDQKSLAEKYSVDEWAPKYYQSPEVYSVYLAIKKPYKTNGKFITKAKKQELVKDGYDGLIFNTGNHTEYVAFTPTQIKSATGNTGAFDPQNPDIRYSRSKAPKTIGKKFQTTVYNSPVESATNAFDTAVDHMNKNSLTAGLDWLRTQMIDRYNPIRTQLGEQIYKLHKLLNNSAVTSGTFLQHGLMKWDESAISVNTKNEGFIPWLKSLGEEGRYFLHWVAAKRSQELYKQDRENWIEPDEAVKIMEEATKGDKKTEAKFEGYAKKLQKFNKNVLDIAQESGLIDPESRKNWETHYYIPFYRILENEQTGEDFLKAPINTKKFLSAGIKRLKGGTSLLGDPMENLLHNWTHLINQSQLNMARKDAGQLMLDIGLADLKKKSDLSKIIGSVTRYDVKDSSGKIDESFNYKKDADEHAAAINGTVHTFKMLDRTAVNNAQIISYQEKGKPVYIKPGDPDLFNALAHVNTKMLDNWLTQLFSSSKRLLTAGATFGAGFRIANLLRDTLHTAIVSKSFVPFIDSVKGLMQVWQKSEDYIRLMASGGGFSQGYLDSGDPKALARSIKKIVKSEGAGAKDTILDTPRKMLALWERVGHASEMAARTQLYSNLRAKEKTHMEAAYEARDLLDFVSTGQSDAVRMATATIPFLNARLQGLDRLARGAAADPKAFALKGAAVSAASLALWYWWKDDDRYKDLEDFDKWQYHHFWIGDTHYRIPKAFEVGSIFATSVETVANIMNDDEDLQFFVNMVGHTATQTFALGVPTLLSPVAEIWANKTFFTGRPIESQWMQKLPEEMRHKPWTPEALKIAGKALNISPVKLETIVRGYTATFGTMILGITDMMLSFDPDSVRPRESFTEFTGLRRFIRNRPENVKQATRFYEFAKEAEKVFNAIKVYRDSGDVGSFRSMLKKHPDYQARRKLALMVSTQLSNIRRREKFIWNNKEMKSDEKKRQLDLLKLRKNEIYKKAYAQIKRFK